MSASHYIDGVIAGALGGMLAFAVLAWCEPEPARAPDSLVCDEAGR